MNLRDWLIDFGGLINAATAVLVGIAIVAFIVLGLKYVFKADNDEARGEGRKAILMSIIIIFVMTSVWGIVNLITSGFIKSSKSVPKIEIDPTGLIRDERGR